MIRWVGALAAIAVTLTACSSVPTRTETWRPKPCGVVYSVARCQAMTDVVAADIGKNRDDVVSVAIVPDAPPGGVHLGAGWYVRVRVALRDGSTHEKEICGGVLDEPACADDPMLEVRSAIGAGYADVPAGSTPLPTIEPSAAGAAAPIAIDSVSIPITRGGGHEVAIGQGSLPNGVWTVGHLEFADPWPDDLALRDAAVVLVLRSLEPDGNPFDKSYVHGWRRGLERVEARLRFDVLWFAPGAALEVRNLVVR